ncbi:hypothetical protein BOTBODRAFT_62590 [Botryobasidium botryosum FD-172 SS1]|uniref:LisH domain-containing protein n=1 Tax=Botryobasidium botryosum (strain FD-172 SS1) TaxID=930990 RepID=A0A067N006_BOTB1|nr:hypothetical protein BOTBODRAFT_62590 [Botryobasidium botryosum FD-172 SS1]
MPPTLSISSDEINCLIYAYLEDSGFRHTSFCLRNEARLDVSPNLSVPIPRGEAVTLLRKALLYSEVEAHWRKDGASMKCTSPFSLLRPHVCDCNISETPVSPVPTPRPELFPPPPPPAPKPAVNGVASTEKRRSTSQTDDRADKRPRTKEPEDMAIDSPPPSVPAFEAPPNNGNGNGTAVTGAKADTQTPEMAPAMITDPPGTKPPEEVKITTLRGHSAQVFVGAWNPVIPNMLATGSKDATARIWTIDSDNSDNGVSSKCLEHLAEGQEERDITSIDWSPDGTLLATGSYDGFLRVWKSSGEPHATLSGHRAPIFAAKWSPTGRWLLTGSLDSTATVWDVARTPAGPEQVFKCHSHCCLDVAWLDDSTFASCSMDKLIHICRLGLDAPVRTFTGHTNEINQIRFSHDRSLLASCSDDMTARVWSMDAWKDDEDAAIPGLPSLSSLSEAGEKGKGCKWVLRGHTAGIGIVTWCPPSSSSRALLATGSFDNTTRLWDARTGSCLRSFELHTGQVYTQSFSNSGLYYATGAGDGKVLIYSVKTGKLLWEWKCQGSVFEISWQKDGKKIAIGWDWKDVAIVDMSRLSVEVD